jgi:hypothetical protein
VAQLGARFHGMEEVVGSIPTRSTKSNLNCAVQDPAVAARVEDCMAPAAILRRTNFSSCGDGECGLAERVSANKFRPIWIGVKSNPHGKPHHPRIKLNAAADNWLFLPHATHESCGVLLHCVTTSADQTL